jgi:hypothetical protein
MTDNNKVQHTPTPYTFDDKLWEIQSRSTIDDGVDPICLMSYLRGYEDECRANARFVVKACNNYESMLNALKTIAHGIDRDCNDFDYYFTFHKDSPLANTIRNAIKQAEEVE